MYENKSKREAKLKNKRKGSKQNQTQNIELHVNSKKGKGWK